MRLFRRKKGYILRLNIDGVKREIHPGDKLHLSQSATWDAGAKKGSATVTAVWDWDGKTLSTRS